MYQKNRLVAYKYITMITAIFSMLAGSAVIFGWHFDISWLKSPIPNTVTMKANTALCFLLCGISLLMLHVKSKNTYSKLITAGSAFIVLVIGLLSIFQYSLGWEFGIDQLLFKENNGEIYK